MSEMKASIRAGLTPDPQESRAPARASRDARRLETVPTCLQPWALRFSGLGRHRQWGQGDSQEVGARTLLAAGKVGPQRAEAS